MRGVRNILCVSSGYIAAVIGAGFASGQEIVSFFVKYGRYSIIGIFIACVIFALFSYAVLSVCAERGIYSYTGFLSAVLGEKYGVKTVETVTLIFAAASVCVMTACAGEIMFVICGSRKILGAFIFTLICGIIFFSGNKNIMRINALLGTVIIFGIIFSCLYILRYREHQAFSNTASMALSGVTYAGYNLITAGALLSGMSAFLKNKREAAISSAVSGFVLFVMITLIWGVLGIYYGKISLGEIPMLTMALRQNKILGGFYTVMLVFAVLTTGVSNGFGIIDILKRKIGRKTAVIFIMAAGFCLSGAGFSNMINTVYRACGYAGIVIVVFIFAKRYEKSNMREKMKENRRKQSKILKK